MLKRRIMAIALSLAVTVTFIPCLASASTDSVCQKTFNTSSIKEEKAFAFQSEEDAIALQSQAGNLPSKVDLRDRGVVTPVKYQSPFGSCWGFAVTAAAETSVLSSLGKTYEETKLDFSEHHLAWFSSTYLNDPDSSQNGEGVHWFLDSEDSSAYMDFGGVVSFGTGLYSSGIGPQLEKDYPYRGKNGRKEIDVLNNRVVGYSKNDDWSIDESARFGSLYRLKESYILPTPADFDADEDGNIVVKSYSEESLDVAKAMLNKGMALALTYCAEANKPGASEGFTYMNEENWCQYTDEFLTPNHGTCIVGYDDNYPKENFNSDRQPPADGAFLVKNSWGSDTENFPNKNSWGIVDENGNHTGYFWLSYYDKTITGLEGFSFDVNNSGCNHYICDQYDYVMTFDTRAFTLPDAKASMANVFNAEYDQILTDVSCMTSSPETSVKYEVYLLNKGSGNLADAKLKSLQTEKFALGGYHKTKLETPVKIGKGQKYYIKVTETNSEGESEIIALKGGSNRATAKSQNLDCYTKAVVNRGESYLIENDTWYDWYDTAERCAKKLEDSVYDYDNFTIRGFSDPVTPPSKVKNLKLKKSGNKVTATWNKMYQAKGYQVAYRTAGTKTWSYKTVKSTSVKLTAKSGKKLQVKVRGYYSSGDRYYGSWSRTVTK